MSAILQCLDEFKNFVRMAFGADAVERMAQGAFFVDNESRASAVPLSSRHLFLFLAIRRMTGLQRSTFPKS
jgi:hypothetical protein